MASQTITFALLSQGFLDFAHPDVIGVMVCFLMLSDVAQSCHALPPAAFPHAVFNSYNLIIPATITFENLLWFVAPQF